MPVTNQTVSHASVAPRIKDLQKKIHDESYINSAIDKIASIISRQIVDSRSSSGNSADFLPD
ncbi:MAG: hypothetical protein J1D88_07425 [Treponema sp.]|nr:hypothetical protein [Treponema sp.]